MTGIGSTDLKRHLAGEVLTPLRAIQAKCADCTGNYADGRVSCELAECPLFQYHPYNLARRKKKRTRIIDLGPGKFSGKPSVESLLVEGEA